MRRLIYSVATSLDGFIAGPHGEYDWIVHDPAYDFAALYARFDTLLMAAAPTRWRRHAFLSRAWG
jgi:hypothetical protein